MEKHQETKKKLDEAVDSLAGMYRQKGMCEKYSYYMAYSDCKMWKELATYLDQNQDIGWNTRLEPTKK